MAAARLGLLCCLALEVGVGQVIEGDGGRQREQVQGLLEQVRLDRRPMRHEGVGGPVQLHGVHTLEVHVQELAQRAATGQPTRRGGLGARLRQAGDDGADGSGAQRRAEAQGLEQCAQAELAQGPQGRVLDPHCVRPHQCQRSHVHGLHIPVRRVPARRPVAGEQLLGDVPGMGLQCWRAIGVQGLLAGAQRLDALAQGGPVLTGDAEVAAEVEQRALAHRIAAALCTHQAVGIVGLAGGGSAGFGAADEHTGEHTGGRRACQ